jgi:2-dehydro-3-deoxyphosphogluconate aldolase / (4S)-4-hydroxy-2-oxoglutarate aldolase
MNTESLTEFIFNLGVLPVIAIESADLALPLADALLEGGLPVAEITFRTQAAEASIRILNEKRPELLLGAGTVLTIDQLEKAKAAGAKFALAPGLNPDVVSKAADINLPFYPGIMTPSEIEKSLALGAKTVKFFPAELNGGIKMLKSLGGPYGHCGIRFIPTGGVNIDNLADYLALETVLAAGGTWIATKSLIADQDWAGITANAKFVSKLVKEIRP